MRSRSPSPERGSAPMRSAKIRRAGQGRWRWIVSAARGRSPDSTSGTTAPVSVAVDEIVPRRLHRRSSTMPSTITEQASSGYVEMAACRMRAMKSRFTFSMGSSHAARDAPDVSLPLRSEGEHEEVAHERRVRVLLPHGYHLAPTGVRDVGVAVAQLLVELR